MAVTITDRLTAAENDVNRILELLQDIITVDDASKHVEILDEESQDIAYRLTSLERKISALKYKWQQAYKRINS